MVTVKVPTNVRMSLIGGTTDNNGAVTPGEINVTWNAPDSQYTSSNTYYVVQYYVTAPGDGETFGSAINNSTLGSITGTSYTINEGLVNGTSYHVQVFCCRNFGGVFVSSADNTGTNPKAAQATVGLNGPTTILVAAVPDYPQITNAYGVDNGIFVQWDPRNNNGASITQYTLTATPGEGDPQVYTVNNGNATSATISGFNINNGTAYQVSITATNVAGTSSSNTYDQSPISGIPGMPTNIQASIDSITRVTTIRWTINGEGGSNITKFTVRYGAYSKVISNRYATSTTVTGLTVGTHYDISVYATNEYGNSPQGTISFTPSTVPGPPTGVSPTIANRQTTVTWQIPQDDGGSTIQNYVVTAVYGGSTVSSQTINGADSTSATLTGLTNGTTYNIRVVAHNAIGDSSAGTANVTPATVPDSPTNVSGTSENGQTTVSWVRPSSDGGSTILSYTASAVYENYTYTQTATEANANSAVITGLTNGTEYTLSVYATNAYGNSNVATATNTIIPKFTPTISVYTGSSITYGQPLSDSTLSGAVLGQDNEPIEGTFSFDTPEAIVDIGSNVVITFTPTSSAYNSVSATITASFINPATPTLVLPTASVTYGQLLSTANIIGGTATGIANATVTGNFTFENPTNRVSTIPLTESILFTPTSSNYDSTTADITLTVNQATPTIITLPTATTTITYGQPLSNASPLTGGNVVGYDGITSIAGDFTFSDSSSIVSIGSDVPITFTPNGEAATYYTQISGNMTTSFINPATARIISSPSANVKNSSGLTLADITPSLSGGNVVGLNGLTPLTGSYTFNSPSTSPNVGTLTYPITFTPSSPDYASVSGNASLTIQNVLITTGTWNSYVRDSYTLFTLYSESGTIMFPQDTTVQYLVVGGGGAGGNGDSSGYGGGGGGGQVIYGSRTFTKDTVYSCSIGGSGSVGQFNGFASSVGGDFTLTALGGGNGGSRGSAGANYSDDNVPNGGGGGSGASGGAGGAGGYNGGSSIYNTGGGGGGGGAGGNGGTTNSTRGNGANGGLGITWSVNTTSYGGGGGGGTGNTTTGGSGNGGGANGGANNSAGSNGYANRGGGGGGGGRNTSNNSSTINTGGSGGTGVIILAFVNTFLSGTATASDIIYGQSTTASTVTGLTATNLQGDDLTGSFALTNISLSVGTQSVSGTFTPSSDNVQSASFTANITVLKYTPVVPLQTTTLTYGQSVPSSTPLTLTNSYNSANITGNVRVTSSTPSFGNVRISGTFQPNDTTNYNSVPANLQVITSQYFVSLANITASLSYGQTLSGATFSISSFTNSYSGLAINGILAYTSPNTKPGVGTQNYQASFTPSDTTNYATVSANIAITTAKYSTINDVSVVTASLTYGKNLSQATFSAESFTNQYDSTIYIGSFSFGANANVVANVNDTSYPATFTPANTSVYTTSNFNLSVTVDPYTPDLTTLPTPTIIYGQKVSSIVLGTLTNPYNGDSLSSVGNLAVKNIQGSYNKTTVFSAGTQTIVVAFTPSSDNYSDTLAYVDLDVQKYTTPTVTDITSTLTYGQSLASTALTSTAFSFNNGTATFTNSYNNASFSGTFSYDDNTIIPSVGQATYSATFNPTTSNNYNTFSANVAITTSLYSVPLTDITATLTYGQMLSQATLSQTSFINPYSNVVINGAFAFATPTTEPDAGIRTYLLTFTPNDTDNYATVSANISVTTSKVTIDLAQLSGSLTYGQPYSSTNYEYNGQHINLLPIFNGGINGTTIPAVGSYSINITLPNTDNYYSTTGNITITVSKYAPVLSTVTGSLTYGTSLANATITSLTNPYSGNTISGTYDFGPSGNLSNIHPDTNSYSVTFTPQDTSNYAIASGNISVTINKFSLSLSDVTASLTYGQSLANAIITPLSLIGANEANITGTYTFDSANSVPSDSNLYSITFTPDDQFRIDYSIVTASIPLTINPYTVDINSQTGTLVYGENRYDAIFQPMTNIYNSEQITGVFSFGEEADAGIPDQGTETLSVTFTPDNSSHYTTATANVYLFTYAYAPSLDGVIASLTYGQLLSDATFSGSTIQNGSGNAYILVDLEFVDQSATNTARLISGIFTFANASVMPNAGQNQSFRVTYTPAYNTNNNDFAAATGNITVNVAQATATLGSLPNVSPIYADQTLANSVITGGSVLGYDSSSLSGSFVFTNPSTSLSAGTNTVPIEFDYESFLDTQNYLPFTTQANIAVISSSSSANVIVDSSGDTAFLFLQQLASTTPPRNTIVGTTGTNYAFTIGNVASSVRLTNTNSFMRNIRATSSDPNNRIVIGYSSNGIIILEFNEDNELVPTEATTITIRLATRYNRIYLRAGSSSGTLIKKVHNRAGRPITFQTLFGVREYTFATS